MPQPGLLRAGLSHGATDLLATRSGDDTMHGVGRHTRRSLISPVTKHRLTTVLAAALAIGGFLGAFMQRESRDAMLLWLGWGLFMLGVTVIVGSLTIGPRPLRSFGVGAWLLVTACGAFIFWLGRGAVDTTSSKGQLVAPLMLVMAIFIAPYAAWMMIWRPVQSWEQETRVRPTSGDNSTGSGPL